MTVDNRAEVTMNWVRSLVSTRTLWSNGIVDSNGQRSNRRSSEQTQPTMMQGPTVRLVCTYLSRHGCEPRDLGQIQRAVDINVFGCTVRPGMGLGCKEIVGRE